MYDNKHNRISRGLYRIGDVMVSVFVLSAVDHGFEPRSVGSGISF